MAPIERSHGRRPQAMLRAMERSSAPVAVRCEDGWILRGERVEGPGPVVVCGHAMMVDRRTLDRPRGAGLVSTLAAQGIDVLAFDARGHGESVPRAEQGGRWSYDDIVRFDVPAMVRAARAIAGDRRVIVLGHSLIGHAAAIAAGLGVAAPDAIVAYAPNLWAPHLEPSRLARASKALLLSAWWTATRARGWFDAASWGAGTDGEAEAYVAQLVSMWRADRLASPDGTTDYEAALARVSTPLLAFSSEADRVLARPASVERFLSRVRGAEHRVLRGPGAVGHMGFVLDARARPVWEETATWIAA